jgi:diguanylate cyclase (GGDEF)-like protein/PAS domain S-box-containing protein
MEVHRGSISGVDGASPAGLPLAQAFADVVLDLPDAIVVCEESGRILLANDGVKRLLGWAPKKLVARPLETLLPRGAASLPRPSEGREVLARHRNGSDVWVELTASRMGEGGRPVVVLDMRDAGPRRRVRERLRRGEASLRVVLEGLPDATVGTARDERIVFVNTLAEELFGYSQAELMGRPVQLLWPERMRERYTRNMQLYFATEHPLRFSERAYGLRRDGTEFVGEMAWGIVSTDEGPLLLAVGRDITGRLESERQLRRHSAQQSALAALSELALGGADSGDLHRQAVQAVGQAISADRLEIERAGEVAAAWGVVVGEAEPIVLEIGTGEERFGSLSVVPSGAHGLIEQDRTFLRAVVNLLATAMDRLRREERTRHQALHDPLTGLANRVLCRNRLIHALARARRNDATAGALFLDLDNFKDVNDNHGHARGDAVLVALAERLRGAVRPSDTVARMGGDEFVVICEDVSEPALRALGDRIQEAIAAPLEIGGARHALAASIGLAIGSGETDPDALLAAADVAAYRAKAAGGGRIEVAREPLPRSIG